jgi:c-di-AMP phosphodiesterase-like protein
MIEEQVTEKSRELFKEIMESEFTPDERSQIRLIERKFTINAVGPKNLVIRFDIAKAKRMKMMVEKLKSE